MSFELSDMPGAAGGALAGGGGGVQQVPNPAAADGLLRNSDSLRVTDSFEPEPEPDGQIAGPVPAMPPAFECGETTQVIGVDENSPVAWSADAKLLAFAARDYGIYIAVRTATGFTVAETLIGSRSSVKKLEFHPSRQLLVSANDEGIKLWAVFVDAGGSNNPANQSRLVQSILVDSTVRTHDASVETVLWLMDGAFLATGSKDNSVKIWELQEVGSSPEECSLRYMETLDSHKAPVLALRYSDASNCLATCGRDSVIKVWSCDTLQGEALQRRRDDTGVVLHLVNNLEGHRGDVVSIAWSETGMTLVSGARDNTIKVWNPHSSECLRTLKAHKGDIHSLIMLPDDKLWSAAADGTFKMWKLLPETTDVAMEMADADAAAMLDVESMVKAMLEDGAEDSALMSDSFMPKDTLESSFSADPDGIMSAALCGPYLATYVESLNAIRIWNAQDIQAPRLIQEFMGHREAVHQVVALSGNRIVSAGGDPNINVYDTATVARIATMAYGGSVNDLTITPDEKLLFAAGTERDIKAYNLMTLQGGGFVNQPVALYSGHCAKIFTIAVSADGSFLASAAQDFDMKTWKIDTAKLLATEVGGHPVVEQPAKLLEAHASAVASLAFNASSDAGGCYLASGGTDHRLAIWNINVSKGTGTEAWSQDDAHDHVISAVCWGRGENSGDMLFSGSWDHTIKMWRFGGGGVAEQVRELSGHMHRIEDMVVTADGSGLLSASWDATVRLWEISKGNQLECKCRYKIEEYGECRSERERARRACHHMRGPVAASLRPSSGRHCAPRGVPRLAAAHRCGALSLSLSLFLLCVFVFVFVCARRRDPDLCGSLGTGVGGWLC